MSECINVQSLIGYNEFNELALDTALSWIPSNTPTKSEVDQMNGCGDTWSTERNTESKILKPHLFLLCLWEWERERCLSLCRCFLSLSRSRSPPSSLEREEWWRLERWEDELPPSLGKTILWRRQIVRVQITFITPLSVCIFQHFNTAVSQLALYTIIPLCVCTVMLKTASYDALFSEKPHHSTQLASQWALTQNPCTLQKQYVPTLPGI